MYVILGKEDNHNCNLHALEIFLHKFSVETANEKPSYLPLGTENPLAAMASGGQVTPQQALLQTMAAMHQKVKCSITIVLFFLNASQKICLVSSIIVVTED